MTAEGFSATAHRVRRRLGGMAAALAAALALGGVPQAGASAPSSRALQRDFTAAAAEFHVPRRVLMAVAYQETLWETHRGRPSATGNYNVMALTEVQPSAFAGGELRDGRGEPAPQPAPGVSAEARRRARAALDSLLSPARQAAWPALQTLDAAAQLTGAAPAALRTDPRQSIRGGAALLASYERAAKGALPRDPAAWYGAVARYSQAATAAAADQFADRVFATMRGGASRTTSDGQTVTLAADSSVPAPEPTGSPQADCPRTLACVFTPAAYALPPGTKDQTAYGNYDLADRPHDGDRIRYLVIHDTEASLAATIAAFRSPADDASAHYVVGQDGSVTQMVPVTDIAWHAGNRSINAHSIGIEHEGYGLRAGSWYTEQEYQSSAQLVRYLARRYHIALDREHLLGHEDVPGPLDAKVAGMHWDPGPYWDWNHYLDLLGAPLRGERRTPRPGETVEIDPPYDTSYQPAVTGCGAVGAVCPPHPVNFVALRTGPSAGAPLIRDRLLGAKSGTTAGWDWSDKAVVGQRFLVSAVQGDWTAIFYGGQQAWFANPRGAYTIVCPGVSLAVSALTPRGTPVYGRTYPEPTAYPPALSGFGASDPQRLTPLSYRLPAWQAYPIVDLVPGDFYYAENINCSAHPDCLLVRGGIRYVGIRFNHRIAFVRLDQVRILGWP
jgi:hypothetical protein